MNLDDCVAKRNAAKWCIVLRGTEFYLSENLFHVERKVYYFGHGQTISHFMAIASIYSCQWRSWTGMGIAARSHFYKRGSRYWVLRRVLSLFL